MSDYRRNWESGNGDSSRNRGQGGWNIKRESSWRPNKRGKKQWNNGGAGGDRGDRWTGASQERRWGNDRNDRNDRDRSDRDDDRSWRNQDDDGWKRSSDRTADNNEREYDRDRERDRPSTSAWKGSSPDERKDYYEPLSSRPIQSHTSQHSASSQASQATQDRARKTGRPNRWDQREPPKRKERRWGDRSSSRGRDDSPRGRSDSESEDDRRRYRSPSLEGKRRAYSPARGPSKRARDTSLSPRSPSRGRSLTRSPLSRSPSPRRNGRSPSPSRRWSTSPKRRSLSPRRRSPSPRRHSPSPRRRSPSSPKRLSPVNRKRSVSPRKRSTSPRKRANKWDQQRWQPPTGPRQQREWGKAQQPFAQVSDGPVKMRQWGKPASPSRSPTRSPSPTGSRRRESPPPPRRWGGESPVQRGQSPSRQQRMHVDTPPRQPNAPPTGPRGFRRTPPREPGALRLPPTGPRSERSPHPAFNGGPQRSPRPGWRPIASEGSGSEAEAPEVEMDVDEEPGPRRADKWSPTKWAPVKDQGSSSLRPEAYSDRMAAKEQQYDQHMRNVSPYIKQAFAQWYAQNATPSLPEFLNHYFGRAPNQVESDQIQQSLSVRSQHDQDQKDSRDLHAQALLREKDSLRKAPPTGPRSERLQTGSSGSTPGPPGDRPPPPGPAGRGLVPPTGSSGSTPGPPGVPGAVAKSSRSRVAPGEAYERSAQVGEGTYGKVYKARRVEDGALVALKRIRMEQEKDGFPVTSMREIKSSQASRHENVVRLSEMMVSKGSVYMVLEYMNHDSTGISSHPEVKSSPANIKSLNYQMLAGLGYLHRRGILHRDMKGSNILSNGDGESKLADFGLARFYNKHKRMDYTNRVITSWYRSPESLMGETAYGPEVDMWSAGCIMLEIFTSKPAFQGSDEISQLEVIYGILGTPDEASWPGIKELPWYELVKPKDVVPSRFRQSFGSLNLSEGSIEVVEQLLKFDPKQRVSADSASQMAYFTTEEPRMEPPTQLASCGEHHEMSVKQGRYRMKQQSQHSQQSK